MDINLKVEHRQSWIINCVTFGDLLGLYFALIEHIVILT